MPGLLQLTTTAPGLPVVDMESPLLVVTLPKQLVRNLFPIPKPTNFGPMILVTEKIRSLPKHVIILLVTTNGVPPHVPVFVTVLPYRNL